MDLNLPQTRRRRRIYKKNSVDNAGIDNWYVALKYTPENPKTKRKFDLGYKSSQLDSGNEILSEQSDGWSYSSPWQQVEYPLYSWLAQICNISLILIFDLEPYY